MVPCLFFDRRKETIIMNRKGSKHLSLADRSYIEAALKDGKSLKAIAEALGKDERTISKEVRKRRASSPNGRSVLKDPAFIAPCKTLLRWPFVCDGCRRRRTCFAPEWKHYDAKKAHDSYLVTLRESREGINMTMEEKIAFDSAIKSGTDKGQSIHAIIASSGAITCSERTAYRLVDQGKTVVQNVDLRRKVKPKKRKTALPKRSAIAVPDGHSYVDFMRHMDANPGSLVTEIDTVMPARGTGKCLLTIHFVQTHFMMAFLLEEKTRDEVARAFSALRETLGESLYRRLFGTILTDRGSEFRGIDAIEFSEEGEKVSSLFYCDAYCSWQKGAIEENHTLIRMIKPKGEEMTDLTQEKVGLMMSHVNSYPRKSLGGKDPYDAMEALIGTDAVRKTGIARIDPGDVILKPELLR